MFSPRLSSAPWLRAVALLLGLGMILALGMAMAVPGCLSIDEVTYLLSARSLALGHGIEVWNGYDELPSPALAPAWLKVAHGRLVSQYPDYFLLLAQPAYRIFGFRGLFLVNVLAFAGVLVLTWRLADRLFSRRAAWIAMGLLTLSTFAWEYAVAAWPHMLSALLILAPLVLVEAALGAGSRRRAIGLAAMAGLIGGVGVGVRLDAAFALAAMGGVLLLVRPGRWREALVFAAGTLPSLAGLALLNRAKFGLASPFTYGPSYGIATGMRPYLPLAIGGAAVFAATIILSRAPARAITSKRWIALVAGFAVVGAFAVSPALRELAGRFIRGCYTLIIDLRVRPLDRLEPALVRAPDGGFLYFGSLKKALLQSCPWIPLAVIPLLNALRGRESRRSFLVLAAAPLALVGIYCFFDWDGGLSLNQRYAVPALPMLAILGARGLESATNWAGGGAHAWILGALGPPVAWLASGATGSFSYARQSLLLLTLPLAVAGLLVMAVLLLESSAGRRGVVASLTAAIASAAVVCGALSTLAYDLQRTLAYRRFQAQVGTMAAARSGGDALLFSEPAELLATAADGTPLIRLANPAKDGYRSFDALARFHVEHRPVLLGMYRPRLDDLLERGVFVGWNLEQIAGNAAVALVRLRPADGLLAGPGVRPPLPGETPEIPGHEGAVPAAASAESP